VSLFQNLLRRLRALRAPRAAPPKRAPIRVLEALPTWAQVGKKRHAHIKRVAELLSQWADEMKVSKRERSRWLRACWLHDALKDAELAPAVTHGWAAADRAEQHGESDRGVLDAVRFHSVGHADWDDVGKMLYLADFLDPGRRSRRRQRARWAREVPHNRDGVLREIVGLRIRSRLRARKTIDPLTVAFWNSLANR
jgi:2-amino-4-hydroxy-6-hydroxymethyldihydropteridine diphosphokinase